LQPVANTWMPPSYTFYNPKARAYAYNPDQARQLLSQMGWQPGADGILQRTMDGKTVRFELEFITPAGRALRERVQQFLADNLKQVGIAVKINNVPAANIVDDKYLPRSSTGAWTGGIMIAQFFAPQTLEGDLFACKNLVTDQQMVANEANGFGGANDTGWCHNEYDRLYSQVLYEFDPAKRKAAFARMQEIFAEEVPYIPLYWRTASYVTRKGLVNYVASTFSGGLEHRLGIARGTKALRPSPVRADPQIAGPHRKRSAPIPSHPERGFHLRRSHSSRRMAYPYSLAQCPLNHKLWMKVPSSRIPKRTISCQEAWFSMSALARTRCSLSSAKRYSSSRSRASRAKPWPWWARARVIPISACFPSGRRKKAQSPIISPLSLRSSAT
jgi:hypothetical protein